MADYQAFTKAYEELERWMEEPSMLPALKRDAERLARSWENNSGEEELKNEIVSRYAQNLQLHDGTIRQLVGAGRNRMNIFTVRRAVQAFANVLASDPSFFGGKTSSAGSSEPVVVVGYDARPESDRFALEAASVLLAKGFRVRLTPEPVPLPFFSYAVTYYNAVSGVMVTGGRSPANYSGLRFSCANGAVFSEEETRRISDEMISIDPFTDVQMVPVDDPAFLESTGKDGLPLLSSVEEPARNGFRNTVLQAVPAPNYKDVSLILSTMNGTGNRSIRDLLRLYGVEDIAAVPDQEEADGSFTTCPSPDPGKPEALRKALAFAEERLDTDLILALSPDAESLGLGVRDASAKDGKASYTALTGAQTAALLLDYLCQTKSVSPDSVLIKCETASPMIDAVAAHYNIMVKTVPAGTRPIADALEEMRSENRASALLFAYDGLAGFFVSPSLLERDAVSASLLAVEMAGFHKSAGRTVLDRLSELSAEFGYYSDRELEIRIENPVPEELPTDLIDEEGVRIYVRKSRVDDRIQVKLSLRKDSEEEASRAMNAAEFSVRGKVKQWFHSIKR